MILILIQQKYYMGNQAITQYQNKQLINKNSFRKSLHTDIKKSNNTSRYDDKIDNGEEPELRARNMSLDFPKNNGYTASQSQQSNYQDHDKILEKLNKKNEQLRKQLREISKRLTIKLQKRKIQIKKKYNNSEQVQTNPLANVGIKRQLQNAYKQIDMYKRQILEMKSKEEGHVAYLKIDKIQSEILMKDKQIQNLMEKIKSLRNIKNSQDKALAKDLNNDQLTTVENYKIQLQTLKNKIKQIHKRDRLRQENYKKQQAYLCEVQSKLRGLNGEYFPQIKKQQKQKEPPLSPTKRKIIYSIGDQPLSPIKKKYSIIDESLIEPMSPIKKTTPTPSQINSMKVQLQQIKKKRQDYHKKIDALILVKNKQIDQYLSVYQILQTKIKTIQNLKIKIEELKKLGKNNKKNLFGSDGNSNSMQSKNTRDVDDLLEPEEQKKQIFDTDHLITNPPIQKHKHSNSELQIIQQKKGQPKIWNMNTKPRRQQKGTTTKGQLPFDDRNLFQEDEYPKIIGFNLWLNSENYLISLQAIYLLDDEIHQGYKSSNANGNVSHFDLKKPDYVKNIGGSFGNDGSLEYLVIMSKQGKIGRYGNLKQGQKQFNFNVNQNERLSVISGASRVFGSEVRLSKFNAQICQDK